MNKHELIEQLNKIKGNPEVRIMNVEIEDNETCPTFELSSIELMERLDRKDRLEMITLQYSDDTFIMNDVKLNG